MTPAQERRAAAYQASVDRLVASFYASGGWTDERRARVKPIFDEAFRRIAAEAAAAEAAAKPAKRTKRAAQPAKTDAATAA